MSRIIVYFLPLFLLFSLPVSYIALDSCAPSGDDDTYQGDDDDDDLSPQQDDDDDETTEESAGPVISDLQIEEGNDPTYGGVYLGFWFHFVDEDGDVVGGYINIYLDGALAGYTSPLTSEYIDGDGFEGNVGLVINSTSGLPGNSTYEFGVSLVDAAGNESNILTQNYTTPDW